MSNFLSKNGLLIFAFLVTVGCKDENSSKDLIEFTFEAALNQGLGKDVELVIEGNGVTGWVPGADITKLVATFKTNGVSVLVENEPQESGVTPNNFSNPVVYWILAEDGSRKQYTVSLTSRAIRTTKEVTSFIIRAKDNACLTSDITAFIGDSHISCFIPVGCTEPVLSVAFETNGAVVKINGTATTELTAQLTHQEPITYVIEAEDGSVKNYSVKFYRDSGLPVVNIKTRDYAPIVSKEEYLDGYMAISNTEFSYKGEIEIKGRGNSSWSPPKKPYHIKLKDKSKILGMPADRDWLLIANYSDKTLLRNRVAFEVGKRVGLPFTPRNQFVEVVLNGDYVGNYLLTEQVEVEESRVNIKELAPTDDTPERINGGYLMEVNARMDELHCWKTNRGVRVCLKSPDERTTTEQLAYIQQYLQDTEDALFGASFTDPENGYAKYINTESFVDWYLVNEVLKNNDAVFYASVFMYKDRDGKLTMGPIWDYDIGMGNINFNGVESPEDFHIRKAGWITRLFKDPAFEEKFRMRWNELRSNELGTILDFIDQEAANLSVSQANNFRRWDILNTWVWPNHDVFGSYQGEVDYLKSWIELRLAWMGAQ